MKHLIFCVLSTLLFSFTLVPVQHLNQSIFPKSDVDLSKHEAVTLFMNDLIITEIMYNPSGSDSGKEWIEIYNNGAVPIDLTGFVLDDASGAQLSEPNISSGVLAPGKSAILFDVDDIAAQEFLEVWGEVNLIAATNFPSLGNGSGDTIGIWNSFQDYSGDHTTQNNAIEKVTYKNNEMGWPNDDGKASIFLIAFDLDNTIGENWSLSTTDTGQESTPVFDSYESATGDIGSPGTLEPTDTEAPIIVCLDTMTITTDEGACSASFDLPAFEINDNVSALDAIMVSVTRSDGLELTDPYPQGETQLTIAATDEVGNTSEDCIFSIIVIDEEAPEIVCPSAISIQNSGAQILTITPPAVSDNCTITPDVSFVRSDDVSLTLEDPFPVGETTIIWTVADESGNTNSCESIVTISLPPSMENDIISFLIPDQIGNTIIDEATKTVMITVPFGTNISALVPTILVSENATIDPASDIVQDFTNPVTYVVIAEDRLMETWTVIVNTLEDDTEDELVVESFMLVNADTNEDLFLLEEGLQIDIKDLPTLHLDIRANTMEETESVRLSLEGVLTTARTENVSPYAVFGDFPAGNYRGRDFKIGQYQITAVPFTKDRMNGEAGKGLTLNFELIDSVPELSISNFTLVNADTNKDIMDLLDNIRIDINELPTMNLNIRANTITDAKSVFLELNGVFSSSRTENVWPFALFGDFPIENYFGRAFEVGSYSITAQPYSEKQLKGALGRPLTINFEFYDSAAIGITANVMTITPNPAKNQTIIKYKKPIKLTSIQVFDVTGRLVYIDNKAKISDDGVYLLKVNDLGPGTYFINAIDTQGVKYQQQMVIKK